MMTMLTWTVVIVTGCIVGLAGWRMADHWADGQEVDRLLAMQPKAPDRFDLSMVAGLPAPARRFFRFAIAEGTPLCTVAELKMRGQFSLGTKAAPNYMDMQATQVLAAPHGFIWKMTGGSGLMRLSGSDSGAWTRFWLDGFVPVARAGGTPDHLRSAFGRYVAEAVFWTPAALLPGPNVTWEQVSDDRVRVSIRRGDLEQSVDVTVAKDGHPTQVVFPRWSNANPEKVHRIQPFGGYLSEFQEFQGYHLPTRVEAGNFFGTEDYFPFYIVDVSDVRFPDNGQHR